MKRVRFFSLELDLAPSSSSPVVDVGVGVCSTPVLEVGPPSPTSLSLGEQPSSSSTKPYSRTSARAASEFRPKRLLRSRGKNGEGAGGSKLPNPVQTVGVGAGAWGTAGVAGAVAEVAAWQGDCRGVGRGLRRGRRGCLKDEGDRRVAL